MYNQSQFSNSYSNIKIIRTVINLYFFTQFIALSPDMPASTQNFVQTKFDKPSGTGNMPPKTRDQPKKARGVEVTPNYEEDIVEESS